MNLPLNGIRVLEMSHAVMGPTCGLVLADMGAEVIKVERAPEGDETRRLIGFGQGFFPFYNRNKKSITLDLKAPRGLELMKKLVASADVLLENFAPGTVSRLGLGYEDLSRINPRLVYCSLKGFLKGPYENRPALDEVVQMMGGLAYMTGPPGKPMRAGASVIDIMGGSYGVIGILTALYEREKTGKGQYVLASLFESTAFLMGQFMALSAITGKPIPPMSKRVSAWAIYEVFKTKEGEDIFIGVTSDRQWKRFCEVFKLSHLFTDPRLQTNNGRVQERSWLIPELQKEFKQKGKEEMIRLAEEAGISFAPIARPEDLFEDRQMNEGGNLVEATLTSGKRTKLPRIPLRMGKYDFGLRSHPPRVGEGTREILKSLSIPESEIEALRKDGILVCE
jgi:crotonobetainyl-CoA:carnitine CoA-transferase CaiB-like acyl-CoA transferase